MLERVDLEVGALERVELGVDTSPLAAIKYTGEVEKDCAAEFRVAKTAFQERAVTDAARRLKATDSEYWVCLCFQTRAQVEEFLSNSGHPAPEEKYVDGVAFAERLGVTVTPDVTPYGQTKIDKKWAGLARKE